jgi:hypothetical protein
MKSLPLWTFAALGIAALTRAASATVADEHGWKPVFRAIQRPVNMQAQSFARIAGKTIPTFTSHVKSPLDGYTFRFTIVGTDPTKAPATTIVSYVPIAIRWHFSGGVVIDPTKPGCGDTKSVNDRFFHSPLFVDTPQTSNGVNVGNVQIIDGFQRAEFWQYVQTTNYHVLLRTKTKAPIILDETAPSGSVVSAGVCSGSGHDLGQIDLNAYDGLLQAVAQKYTTPDQLPMIMDYNIVQTQGGCCIIGYHSVTNRKGIMQPYATGAYTDPGIFSAGIQDIDPWSHETGELFNDPYVNNITPAWGHVGQVGGCQGNLETGDPLSGTVYLDTLNGFTYHPQEQAFFSWFYRTPSSGTGGLFSYQGSFTSAQGACD